MPASVGVRQTRHREYLLRVELRECLRDRYRVHRHGQARGGAASRMRTVPGKRRVRPIQNRMRARRRQLGRSMQ